MSSKNPLDGIHLNQPNMENFNARREEREKRVNSIKKDFNGIRTISEKTLNKRFTI